VGSRRAARGARNRGLVSFSGYSLTSSVTQKTSVKGQKQEKRRRAETTAGLQELANGKRPCYGIGLAWTWGKRVFRVERKKKGTKGFVRKGDKRSGAETSEF